MRPSNKITKGLRFYEEFTDETKTTSMGNVIALDPEDYRFGKRADGTAQILYTCLSAVSGHADSDVNAGDVSGDYLRERCKRVNATRASEIHPSLFRRLEADHEREKSYK